MLLAELSSQCAKLTLREYSNKGGGHHLTQYSSPTRFITDRAAENFGRSVHSRLYLDFLAILSANAAKKIKILLTNSSSIIYIQRRGHFIMQALANKSFLGNGLQAVAAKQRCTRKVAVVKASAAPAATKLNTTRSDEVGLVHKIMAAIDWRNATRTETSREFGALPSISCIATFSVRSNAIENQFFCDLFL